MNEEIGLTIKIKLEGKMDDTKSEAAIKAWFVNNTHNIPGDITKLGITVSYDMG